MSYLIHQCIGYRQQKREIWCCVSFSEELGLGTKWSSVTATKINKAKPRILCISVKSIDSARRDREELEKEQRRTVKAMSNMRSRTVSYTHLTLPTKRIV